MAAWLIAVILDRQGGAGQRRSLSIRAQRSWLSSGGR